MASQFNVSFGDQPTHLTEEEYHKDIALLMVPGMVILGLMMLIGLFGNILVLYVYSFKLKRSTTNLFIIALAVSDIVVCSVCIPKLIVVMMYLYSFNNPWLCRILVIINICSVNCSVCVLIIIAVDRYRRICKPFTKQITITVAKIALAIGCVLSAVCASPAMVIYGSRTINRTFTVHACSTDDSMIETPYPGLYNGMQFVLEVTTTIILTVLYSLILRKVKTQEKYRTIQTGHKKSKQICHATCFNIKHYEKHGLENANRKPQLVDRRPEVSTARINQSTRDTLNEDVSSTVNVTAPIGREATIDKDVTTGQCKSYYDNYTSLVKSKHNHKASHKTTFMMFLVTVVFVLSFIPHLGLMATRAVQKHTFEHLEGVSLAVYQIFLKSYLINSIGNPIIYSFLSDKFQREVKILLKRPTSQAGAAERSPLSLHH